jgi:DNA-binding NtrC family response regulator
MQQIQPRVQAQEGDMVREGSAEARTVLISDPSGAIRRELKEFLESTDVSSISAATIKDTLLTIQRTAVDVLVLDSSMLGDDCSIISIVKGIQHSVPIIVCAEVNSPELERCAREKGIFFYHIKSFGSQDLEMAILSALQKASHY